MGEGESAEGLHPTASQRQPQRPIAGDERPPQGDGRRLRRSMIDILRILLEEARETGNNQLVAKILALLQSEMAEISALSGGSLLVFLGDGGRN